MIKELYQVEINGKWFSAYALNYEEAKQMVIDYMKAHNIV
jgi:hypothetical protein